MNQIIFEFDNESSMRLFWETLKLSTREEDLTEEEKDRFIALNDKMDAILDPNSAELDEDLLKIKIKDFK